MVDTVCLSDIGKATSPWMALYSMTTLAFAILSARDSQQREFIIVVTLLVRWKTW